MNINIDKHCLTPEYNKYGMQIAQKEDKYGHGKSQNWMFQRHRFSCHHLQCKLGSTKLEEVLFLSVLYCLAYTAGDDSRIYVETSSFETYFGCTFPYSLTVLNKIFIHNSAVFIGNWLCFTLNGHRCSSKLIRFLSVGL